MTRTRMMLIVPAMGLAGLAGLAGCGAPTPAGVAAGVAADVADEAVALQQVGFDTGVAPTPSPSATAHQEKNKKVKNRKYLRKNTLHGEVTVQGKNGARTIVVQRGAVTALTATGVTVKSTDGYTLTWTFGDKVRVVEDKKAVAASTLKTGEQIGVAGAKDGSATDARLIAVK